MSHIWLALFVLCVALVGLIVTRKPKAPESTVIDMSVHRESANRILRSSKRLAQLVVLISYSDLSGSGNLSSLTEGNKNLIIEIRKIVRQHMPNATSREASLITAQLLVIAKKIGVRRKEKNARMSLQKCE